MNLIILRCKLVEAFLDDVITIQILDENDNTGTECNNDRVDLSIASMNSLLLICKFKM